MLLLITTICSAQLPKPDSLGTREIRIPVREIICNVYTGPCYRVIKYEPGECGKKEDSLRIIPFIRFDSLPEKYRIEYQKLRVSKPDF